MADWLTYYLGRQMDSRTGQLAEQTDIQTHQLYVRSCYLVKYTEDQDGDYLQESRRAEGKA